MSHDSRVARRQVEIVNALGLHMRPAAKFVDTANRFQAEIRVHYRGRSFDGRSILDLLSLAAECGSLLELEATGDDAEMALDALVKLIADRFFEDANGGEIAPGTGGAVPPDTNPVPAPDAPLPPEPSP